MRGVRLLQEGGDVVVRAGDRLQQGNDIGQFAKAVHRQERRQGEDQFGLVIGVFVIAFGGAQRDAGGVLFREADLGRRFAQVDWIDSG